MRKPGTALPQAPGKGPGAPEKANILLLYCPLCHKITSHVWSTTIGSSAFPNIALLSFLHSSGGASGYTLNWLRQIKPNQPHSAVYNILTYPTKFVLFKVWTCKPILHVLGNIPLAFAILSLKFWPLPVEQCVRCFKITTFNLYYGFSGIGKAYFDVLMTDYNKLPSTKPIINFVFKLQEFCTK